LNLEDESTSATAAVHQGSRAQVPLDRFGEAGGIAKAVAYLVSPDAAYVTGTELLIDGGMAQG